MHVTPNLLPGELTVRTATVFSLCSVVWLTGFFVFNSRVGAIACAATTFLQMVAMPMRYFCDRELEMLWFTGVCLVMGCMAHATLGFEKISTMQEKLLPLIPFSVAWLSCLLVLVLSPLKNRSKEAWSRACCGSWKAMLVVPWSFLLVTLWLVLAVLLMVGENLLDVSATDELNIH